MDYCQGVIDDIRITCAVCGEYHSIFTGCAKQPADIPLDQSVAECEKVADEISDGIKAAMPCDCLAAGVRVTRCGNCGV